MTRALLCLRILPIVIPRPSAFSRLFSSFSSGAKHNITMTAAAKQAFVPLPECLAKMAPKSSPELDYSTNSNYSAFKVQQTALDFELKFDEKILHGSVTYQLSDNSATDKIMLDLTTVAVSKVLVNHKPAAYKSVSENLANNIGKESGRVHEHQ